LSYPLHVRLFSPVETFRLTTTFALLQFEIPTGAALDTLTSTATRNAFLADLGLAHETSRASVVPKRTSAQDGHWDTRCEFCREFMLEPTLSDLPDPVPILQVFATRLRDERIAPSRNSLRSRMVAVTTESSSSFSSFSSSSESVSLISVSLSYLLVFDHRSRCHCHL
jgi:hypothetical protein